MASIKSDMEAILERTPENIKLLADEIQQAIAHLINRFVTIGEAKAISQTVLLSLQRRLETEKRKKA